MTRGVREPAARWRRLGERMDRGTPERKLSSVLITIAAFALTVVVAFVGVLVGSYQERIERDHSRVPASWATAVESTNEGPRWRIIADVVDDRWVHVIVIVPDAGSPLPPGLVQWPEPGDVVLSPGLKGTALGDEIVGRYGEQEASEVIGPSGVVSVTERIAYVRPSADLSSQTSGLPYGTLGVPFPNDPWQEGLIGGAAYQRPLGRALIEFGLVFGLPALILMCVSARTASVRRDRRLRMLVILGAGPRECIAVLWGSVGRPLMAGAVAAAVALLIVAAVDLPIPATGAVLSSRDIRAQLPLILLCAVVGWLLSLGVVLVSNWPRRARGTRPAGPVRRERAWGMVGLPIASVASALVLLWTFSWEDAWPRILVVYAGVAGCAVFLPSFVGSLTAVIAKCLVWLGRSAGSAACIVAGRQLLHDPRAVRRLAAGMALIIVLIANAIVLSSLKNSYVREAEKMQATFGSSLADVQTPESEEAHRLLTTVLDGEAGILALSLDYDGGEDASSTLTATCPTLTAVGLSCDDGIIEDLDSTSDPRLGVVFSWAREGGIHVKVGDPLSAETGLLYAVSFDGEDLPLDRMAAELSHAMIPAPQILPLGESWVAGLQESRDQGRWTVLGAAVSTVLLGLSIAGSAAGDAGVQSRKAGVASLWGADIRFAAIVVAGRVLVPLIVAVTTGALVALVTTYPLTLPPLSAKLTAGYFLATTVLPVAAALVISVVSIRFQAAQLAEWRPGKER